MAESGAMGCHCTILVIGDEPRTAPLTDALARGPFLTRRLTPRQALRSPGSCLDADLVLWVFQPGSHPSLESETHAAGVGALHVRWSATDAEVGPLVFRGFGPCPACLAASVTCSPDGADPLFGAWTCSWAALQCASLLKSRRSELVGASWRWDLREAALTLARWPRRPDCPVPGCVQPRCPITSSTDSPYLLTFD